MPLSYIITSASLTFDPSCWPPSYQLLLLKHESGQHSSPVWQQLAMGGNGFDFLSFHAGLPVTFSSPLKQCRTGVWQFSTRAGEKKRKINKTEKRRGKMRVQRIKATWDGEIEFKSATNKWCTALTCARRKGWWQTRNEGRKQTCYQGLEREAEPFSNFLSAPKWKHKGEETALWKLRFFDWESWPSCNRWVCGWNTVCPSEIPWCTAGPWHMWHND